MESHLTSLRGSVWSHFLISLFNCLNILENKLVRIKIICPGWWIQKHTEKNIPWLTENTFLFHTGLLLLEYLHSYHSTKKLTIFSSTPTKLWEMHTLNVKTQTIFSLTSFSRAAMAYSDPTHLPPKHFPHFHSDAEGCMAEQGTSIREPIQLAIFQLHLFLSPAHMPPQVPGQKKG